MTDFFTPVQIDRAAFELLIMRVDEAVGQHAVALLLNEDFPFRALEPVDSTSINLSGINLKEDPLKIVDYLDQLMYFAFESAPDEIITSWADGYDEELAGEAVDRVKFMSTNMPALARLWEAKNNSILPPLINFGYDFAMTPSGDREAHLYFAAARITEVGRPDKSDMSRMRFQLWPSDVRVLIRDLEHLWNSHLADLEPEEEEEGGEGGSETDSTASS